MQSNNSRPKWVGILTSLLRIAIGIVLILAPTVYFGMTADAGKMGIAAAAGAAAAMLLNLDRLKYLKLGIMEAQLQEKIEVATATLAALQELASASLAAIIKVTARYGRWGGGGNADDRIAEIERLIAVAIGLKVSHTEEIRKAIGDHRRLTAFDRFHEFHRALSTDTYPSDSKNRVGRLFALEENRYPNRDEIMTEFKGTTLLPDDQHRLKVYLEARANYLLMGSPPS